MVFKKKSTYKKERDQKRWTMFMAQHETAIQFQFFNVPEAECISFMKVSRLTVPDQKKRIKSFKRDFSIKGNNNQQKNLEIFETFNIVEKNKENMTRKLTQDLTLEEKLEDAQAKQKLGP